MRIDALRIAVARASLAVALLAGPAWAGVPPWPASAYTHFAENVPIETVLREFTNNFSLGLALQPGVAGLVNGRFSAPSPSDFLSRLGGVYGFSWYTHGGVLHVSRTAENLTRAVPLPPGGATNLRQALLELGVLEPRFGWGELPDQGVVVIAGPMSYVNLVESTIRQLPGSNNVLQLRMFRLRHASAEDRVVPYRDQRIVQPGLATVLRRLLGDRMGALSAASVVAGGADAATPGLLPLRAASMLLGETAPAGGPAAGAVSGSPPGPGPAQPPGGLQTGRASPEAAGRTPTIQSDPRLNALIIQDLPERMPLYERLIAQLDVPTPLIEIEALIIDVNSERSRELGINWSLQAGGATFGFGTASAQSGPGLLSLSYANAGASTIISGSGTALLSQIRALEVAGDARIQSRPSVLTTDNLSALLDLSETFYIRIAGERVANVAPVTAGTTLRVTPRLVDGPEPAIQLSIDIEDGQIQDRQIDLLPTVRRSSVSTQAVVRLNETLLIAGYATDQNVQSSQKVPVLGNLPAVGALFSSKTSVLQRRERLFMIKPKLVSVPTGLANANGAGRP